MFDSIWNFMANHIEFGTFIIAAFFAFIVFLFKYIKKRTGINTDVAEGIIKKAEEKTISDLEKTHDKYYSKPKPVHINSNQVVNEHSSDFKIIGTVKKPEATKVEIDTPKQEEEIESKAEDKPKRKRGRPRKVPLALILIFMLLGINSCSVAEAIGLAKQVGITWSADDSSDKQAIDSVQIISKPVYWKEPIDTINFEKEFIQDGYRVWILQADGMRRIEVQRLDTIMKVYKK